MDRCIMGFNSGPPMTSGAYNNNVQIFQAAGYVVILNEMVHNARIIPLDDRPRPDFSQYAGISRGRWDGDVLGGRDDPLPRRAKPRHRPEHASDRSASGGSTPTRSPTSSRSRIRRSIRVRIPPSCRCGGSTGCCSSTRATRGIMASTTSSLARANSKRRAASCVRDAQLTPAHPVARMRE